MPVAQALEWVAGHPAVVANVTVDSGRSLPVLTPQSQGVALTLFWYPAGGPQSNRIIGAPYFQAHIPLDDIGAAVFRRFTPSSIGIDVAPLQELGPSQTKGAGSIERALALQAALIDGLDRLAPRLSAPTATLRPDERAAARVCLDAYDRLSQVVLRDFYRAISPAFFPWLEAAAG